MKTTKLQKKPWNSYYYDHKADEYYLRATGQKTCYKPRHQKKTLKKAEQRLPLRPRELFVYQSYQLDCEEAYRGY